MQPEINSPFRGWKGTLFEGGLRVPLLLRWPAVLPPGREVTAPVSHVDLFPTLLAAAAAENPPPAATNPLSGVNLLPAMLEQSGEEGGEEQKQKQALLDRVIFWRSGHYKALRKGKWKLQKSGNPDKLWLYDMDKDPHEWDNLAVVEPYLSEVLPALLALLLEEDARQSESLWPSLTETAFHVDKMFETNETLADEYVYWPN